LWELKKIIYINKDKTYHLPRHGFARDIIFELIDKKRIAPLLQSIIGCDKKTVPFDFQLQINYTLENKHPLYKVVNKSLSQLPLSGHILLSAYP
jgi:galactose mutarotase-like enzyme